MYKPPTIEEIIPREKIFDAFYETGGKLTHAAKKLLCSHNALYGFVERDDEAKKVLKDARYMDKEARVDDSEEYVYSIAERYKDDTTNGLKAAIYTLETHGKNRGWGSQAKLQDEKTKADTLNDRLDAYVNERTAQP